MKKKICINLVDRANYGRLKPLIIKLKKEKKFEIKIICSGSMLIGKYGETVNILKKDGLKVNYKIFSEIDGSKSLTMAKSIGLTTMEYATILEKINPDYFLVIGDRYQALGSAIAAAYQNIPIIHLQGGEESGTMDQYARHCITKLAHLHFPATDKAKKNIINLGEDPKSVFNYGCPSGDMILGMKNKTVPGVLNKIGVGAFINFNKPYYTVVYHPDTINFTERKKEILQMLFALNKLKHQTVWLWPNIDAGSDYFSLKIRQFRERFKPKWLRLIKHLEPEDYVNLLRNSKCLIGNSSSFVRDSSFMGVPSVIIGERQIEREHNENVKIVKCDTDIIVATIKKHSNQIFKKSKLYGNGKACQKIIKKIKNFKPNLQKKLNYKS
tara:strand:- start:7302 stop:8450 length:1149 start_codon:yes stop_codon:yes gene_type:complete